MKYRYHLRHFFFFFYILKQRSVQTRKSPCVNARGIRTATYQVLHLLSCTGGVLHPCQWGAPRPALDRGYPHPALDGGWYPHLALDGEVPPSLDGKYPHPALDGGYPHRDRGYQMGVPPIQGWMGVPTLAGPDQVTPLWTDRWTDTCQNMTFPSYYVRGR